jgi:major capsid protein E
MSIDIYDPRSMAQALLQMKPPRSFLRTLMIQRDEFYNNEQVDVDVKVGARRLAPFVNPNKGPGKVMDRIGFETRTYTAPMIAPKRPLTVTDLQKRMPGENVYQTQTPDERAAMLLGQDLAELDEDITRREEWMCAQAAFTSEIVVTGDDVNETISFPRTNFLVDAAPAGSAPNGLGTSAPTSTQLANARLWTASTADIPTQIRQMRRIFIKQTGLAPDYAVMGEAAADALLTAPSLSGLTGFLNTLRMDLGQIKPELRDGGATYYGMFAGTGIDLWGYDEWYIDPADGVEKPMVPAKMILMGSSKGYTVMRYGAVGVSSGVDGQAQLALIAGRRVPESWVSKEPAVRFLKISARPLVVPVQNDAYLTCQVVA